MTIIDELNARIERGKASDAEIARLVGMTVEEFDADTTESDPDGYDEDFDPIPDGADRGEMDAVLAWASMVVPCVGGFR